MAICTCPCVTLPSVDSSACSVYGSGMALLSSTMVW